MNAQKQTRRKFIRKALVAPAAVAVAAPAAAASAEAAKPVKKIIYKPGEKPSPDTILSSGVRLGNLLFVSGQGAHDPVTHKVVEGPIENQVRRCLENIKAVLEAAGSSLDQVVKCTVLLTDIANYKAMNQVYHSFFPSEPPARSTMAVKDLPGDSPVEIECIADVG